jgi:predicted acylesterase/phospholipase RssA
MKNININTEKCNDTQTLPQKPFEEIALAISGGGFRAAAYGLGTMMYLDRLKFKNQSLLQRIKFMSSASGGTIPVVFYSLSLHNGENFEKFKARLLAFMQGEQILNRAIHILSDDVQWENNPKTRNLINAFSKVYSDELEGKTWKIIWENSKSSHLKEVCINSTEFYSGLSFRFQNKEQGINNTIGNRSVSLKESETVKNLKLGDLLAASSCFPIGFEPLIFPNDFVENEETVKTLLQSVTFMEADGDKVKGIPFGLMDGGVVDNQGLDSMMKAFDRRDNKKPSGTVIKPFDLMIVADVSNRLIRSYDTKTSELENSNNLNFYHKIGKSLLWIGIIGCGISITSILFNFFKTIGLLLIVPSILIIIVGVKYRSIISRFSNWFVEIASKDPNLPLDLILKYVDYFTGLKLSTLSGLINSRLSSTVTMTSEVFLKRIRSLIFDKFYEDKDYAFRRVSSFVYSLSTTYYKSPEKDKESEKTKEIEKYHPSNAMKNIAEQARTFNTTLWFTDNDNKNEVLKSIIATAQFTLCTSLLNYFVELEKEAGAFQKLEEKDELLKLKDDLLSDWEKFKVNPFFIHELSAELSNL